MLLSAAASAGSDGHAPHQAGQSQDPCWRVFDYTTIHVRQILEAHLKRRFPVTAQLAEGNARLSEFSPRIIDCEQQRLVVSGSYEFRGNIGVMDLTRRGTAVIQLRLTPDLEQRRVRLEDPEVLDITFDNPAPWFDGKAIYNWALELFATSTCANLQDGQPC
jgi:hypothetical protein